MTSFAFKSGCYFDELAAMLNVRSKTRIFERTVLFPAPVGPMTLTAIDSFKINGKKGLGIRNDSVLCRHIRNLYLFDFRIREIADDAGYAV